ncbi:MAG: TIGR04255 family protein [Candidatus Dormiibacterota bacterium]
MPPTATSGPFVGGPPEEVFLPQAPLEMVIAQVRYPKSPDLTTDEAIRSIQGAIKDSYPVLRDERAVGLLINAEGVKEGPPADRIWRFKSRDEGWQVSLTDTFLALHTTRYTTRDDFCSRFERLARLIETLAPPPFMDRIGIRYHNRLVGPVLTKLDDLIAQPLLGLTSETMAPAILIQSLSQAQLSLEGVDMLARWGTLAANTTVDPSIRPSAEVSWIFDVDVYQGDQGDFDAGVLDQRVRRYAGLAYRFFRWATTDQLVRRFGESPNDP